MGETLESSVWLELKDRLKQQVSSQEFTTWLNPLRVEESGDNSIILYAPNRFVKDWVKQKYISRIQSIATEITGTQDFSISIEVGTTTPVIADNSVVNDSRAPSNINGDYSTSSSSNSLPKKYQGTINPIFTFDNYVEGKSNQLARAASQQVGENPGKAYNPLFIYGGVGLGKTHLMHAVGNSILGAKKNGRVVYLHSERFVADMVKALQSNLINEFKKFYRSVDALLIDDIQFFAGKERSQEEFFHTFNALLEGQSQVILTSDRYPKEIKGVEERLKSRFGWGLTVSIEPPELETRVAILMSKAEQSGIMLPDEVGFFIGKHIRSNVRELEGALKRVSAHANFTGQVISIDLVKEALKDLLALQNKLVTVENIQKTVAEYYKIRLNELLSKRRSRSIARPRQIAMALAKELTNHSLPELGDKFGGRDHTTVLHACRTVKSLINSDPNAQEDWNNLMRILST